MFGHFRVAVQMGHRGTSAAQEAAMTALDSLSANDEHKPLILGHMPGVSGVSALVLVRVPAGVHAFEHSIV